MSDSSISAYYISEIENYNLNLLDLFEKAPEESFELSVKSKKFYLMDKFDAKKYEFVLNLSLQDDYKKYLSNFDEVINILNQRLRNA